MKIPDVLALKALAAKQHSPTGLFVGGVVGMVGSTVLACRATLKLSDTLTEIQNDKEIARAIEREDYSEQDRRKDLTVIQVRGAISVVKLYAPSVVVGAASIAMLTKSHNILQERNAALTAAYVALDKGFKEYRARVVDRYGENVDHELRFPREKIKEPNPETGRERTVEVIRPLSGSEYARIFDESSVSWTPDADYNLLFLKNKQNWWNDRLWAKGHVFLNEIYDDLGLERSQAGQIVGWVKNAHGGDGYIDFGIFDSEGGLSQALVNAHRGGILVDFNVDGPVLNMLPEFRGPSEVNEQ